jgi:hypothetical protein
MEHLNHPHIFVYEQEHLRRLRNFLRGWARNQSSVYKKEKQPLLDLIYNLDIKAETVPLSSLERETLKEANSKVAALRRDEESK